MTTDTDTLTRVPLHEGYLTSLSWLPTDRAHNAVVKLLLAEGGCYDQHSITCFKTDDAIAKAWEDRSMAEALGNEWVTAVNVGNKKTYQKTIARCYCLAPAVGMFATWALPNDRYPYEIVHVSPSGTKITLRPLSAERDPSWQPDFVAGGFVGHTFNDNELKYSYARTDGSTVDAFRTKWGTYRYASSPIRIGYARKFYDSNL